MPSKSTNNATFPAGLSAPLAVVQILDVTSTRAALKNGAVELNATMRGSVGQQRGIKAAMTIGTVVAANGALAMITASNMHNARMGR